MGLHAHRRTAPASVAVTLLTLSDSRDSTSDTTGQLIGDLLTAAGHTVAGYSILPEEPAILHQGLELALARADSQALILNGGTGVAPRDITPEVVRPFLEKELPGFGELFRQLSYREIGSAALLSRALAGIANSKVLFILPGSQAACKLALEQLILPELAHLVGEASKGQPSPPKPREAEPEATP